MEKLKKAAILGGAIVGGAIGGSCSLIGKLAKVGFLDELGGAIIDSTILTGSIAGEIASGTIDTAAGALRKNKKQRSRGLSDLKSGGGKVFQNWVDNFYVLKDNGGEILCGIKDRDGRRVLNGAKTLGKVAAIGAITVGAVEVGGSNTKPAKSADSEKPAKFRKPLKTTK